MNLTELIKDIDYKKEFSYEKRVDLFNKYSYSTTHSFFVPIYELACYIINITTGGTSGANYYGHGQKVLNTSLIQNVKEGKEKRIEIKGNFIIINFGDFRVMLNNIHNTVKFSTYSRSSINIPRDLYDKIDEWLVDLGYEKW